MKNMIINAAIILMSLGFTLTFANGGLKHHQLQVVSGKLVFTTTACGGNSDNKDHDTKVNVVVYGIHGYPIAYRHYTDDVEFPDDGSTREIPLIIGDENNPGNPIFDDSVNPYIQKLYINIDPNGNDTWVFSRVQVVFNLSDGSTSVTDLNQCTLLNQQSRAAVIWHR